MVDGPDHQRLPLVPGDVVGGKYLVEKVTKKDGPEKRAEEEAIQQLRNMPENLFAIGNFIRTNAIERPEQIVERIKKVLAVVPPEKVTLSTDCGMKPLARMVAKMKLRALTEAARSVRAEVVGA